METFDTDGDGKISGEETPTEEQLEQFVARHRDKSAANPIDTKRKSRIEAETAVKAAMRELEEARMREEMSVREELEAHKSSLAKAQKGLEQCNEEIEKLKQTDLSRQEKTEAAIAKLEQEKTHEEELIRHGIRAKKTASLENEDRIQELKAEVGLMCEENAQRIEKEAEEDRQRQEERRIAQERFEERLKVKQAEQRAREEDKKDQDEGENRLKHSLKDKELQFQERARQIKFEEDDDHSRIEHQMEVVGKKAEKFSEQINIEGEEIRDLSAKVDARRIALANEKKAERRLSVAEHEADLLMEVREKEEVAVPVIDQSRPTLPDLEPTLSKKLDPKPVKADKPPITPPSSIEDKPVIDRGQVRVPEPEEESKVKLPEPLKPEIAEAESVKVSPVTEETSQVKKEKDSDESVLPAIIKTETKSSKPIPPENEKPAFSPEPEDALSNLPELPQPKLKAVDDKSLKVERSVEEDKPKKKEGIFGRILGGKKKKSVGIVAEPVQQSSEVKLPPLPKPSTEGPEPDLPPLPVTALQPSETVADIPTLPPLPSGKSDLPPLPGGGESTTGKAKELERKALERKLERIADQRAQRLKDAGEEVALEPVLQKPTAGGEKPALPSLPKPGGSPGGLPPMP